jgi:hypothetical protein
VKEQQTALSPSITHIVQPTKVNQIHIHWSITLWNLWNIASSPNSPQIPLLPEEGRRLF